MRKRCSHRRAIGTRAPILVEARPNARWSLDCVHDQFATGRRFRILNVVDHVNPLSRTRIPPDLRRLSCAAFVRQRRGSASSTRPGL